MKNFFSVVARVDQEPLARIYAPDYGIGICCTRSFNHCSLGQTDRFVVSAIVKQCARIDRGRKNPVIYIGNGTIMRDFIDTHNMAEVSRLLMTQEKCRGSLGMLQRQRPVNPRYRHITV